MLVEEIDDLLASPNFCGGSKAPFGDIYDERLPENALWRANSDRMLLPVNQIAFNLCPGAESRAAAYPFFLTFAFAAERPLLPGLGPGPLYAVVRTDQKESGLLVARGAAFQGRAERSVFEDHTARNVGLAQERLLVLP